MKTVKILSALLAIIMAMSMFVACNTSGDGEDTPPVSDGPVETKPRFKATAHLKIVNYDGKELYATDDDEPYEYDSAYYEPTAINFIDDYAFMNDKEFAYKKDSNGLITSITIITRKKTTQYKAGDTVEKVENGVTNTYKTIWVCYINDEEVSAMDEVVVKDGDVVELRIVLIKV